jgi:hypothetical protein
VIVHNTSGPLFLNALLNIHSLITILTQLFEYFTTVLPSPALSTHPTSIAFPMKNFVWLFACPLSITTFIPSSNATSEGSYPLCRWGILVTQMDVAEFSEILRCVKERMIEMESREPGLMYELRPCSGNENNLQITRAFSVSAVRAQWGAFSAQFVGTRSMTHEEIERGGKHAETIIVSDAQRFT